VFCYKTLVRLLGSASKCRRMMKDFKVRKKAKRGSEFQYNRVREPNPKGGGGV